MEKWLLCGKGGAVAILALILIGCGQDGPPTLAPVSGKVYYRGQPLSTGTIVFAADPSRGTHGPLAQAEIQPEGTFQLKTGDQIGAVAGWHRVTIVAVHRPVFVAGQAFSPPQSLLPARYGDPELSGLVCEVKGGQNNTVNFNLE